MTAQAASQAMPTRVGKIAAWIRARLDQAAQARLAIRIGHCDILAFPPQPHVTTGATQITTS
jgi:hypothetical protein